MIHDFGFTDFEDSYFSRNLNSLPFRAQPRQRDVGEEAVVHGRGERARGRAFRKRFQTSSHARNAPRTLRSKFRKIQNSRSRNFGDFWNSRFSEIQFLVIPVLLLDNVMQVMKGGASRGRAAVCLEHVSACPTMPALPHDRSGASLGKSKISVFEIFVVRFGPYLPFLALSCARSVPILLIFAEFPREYRFLTST